MLSSVIVKVAGAEKEPRGIWYPRASLSGCERCIRQDTYWARGVPEDKAIGDRYIMTIDDSTWHEYLTNDWLSKTAFSLHSAQLGIDCLTLDFLKPEPKRKCKTCDKKIDGNIVHGHTDGIITDILMFDRLYEHKAINHFTFEKLWNGDYPLDYFTQMAHYLKGLKKDLPNIKEGILLIKNKNTAQYIDYKVTYDEEKDQLHVLELEHSGYKIKVGTPCLFTMENVIANSVDRFRQIIKHFKNKTLPERQYELGDWQCNLCSWGETCWEGYEREYKALVEDAVLEAELETACHYYLELNMHLKMMEQEKEEFRKKFKQKLRENNASKGRAGAYTVHNQLRKRKHLNRELIPDKILERATYEKNEEVLMIRKPKEEKPKKEKKKYDEIQQD